MDAARVAFQRVTSLAAYGDQNVFASGVVDTAPAVDHFVLIQIGSSIRQLGGFARSTNVLIYVHDRGDSKTPIFEALESIQAAMTADPAASEAGLISVTWENESTDLVDDFYKSKFRMATYRFVGGK
jgi:hypothetical protein